tara:strand:- start:196 stop:720 length:525 start_codon:yes stop_codon:yes gene_type:complete
LKSDNDNFWSKIIYIISFVIIGAVVFLILGPRPDNLRGSLDVSMLPSVNVIFNIVTIFFLIIGYFFILKKKRVIHKRFMLYAFGSSSAFLVSYIIYHWFKSGPKLYSGSWTSFYYTILFSHIVLAAIITPLALFTLYHGWNNSIQKHKKIARITLPLWLYVSVTGVLIYGMLYL